MVYLWYLQEPAISTHQSLQSLDKADAAFLQLLLLCHAVIWLQPDSSLGTHLPERLHSLQVVLTPLPCHQCPHPGSCEAQQVQAVDLQLLIGQSSATCQCHPLQALC